MLLDWDFKKLRDFDSQDFVILRVSRQCFNPKSILILSSKDPINSKKQTNMSWLKNPLIYNRRTTVYLDLLNE
jgi:hypothetical protein